MKLTFRHRFTDGRRAVMTMRGANGNPRIQWPDGPPPHHRRKRNTALGWSQRCRRRQTTTAARFSTFCPLKTAPL